MHKRGIVHRDIKPENIMYETSNRDSSLKIIDLGLAQKHCESSEPLMNATVGTPYYIAPEVLQKKYGKSCDLWSIGVVSYILLCGYPPFDGANDGETRSSVLSGEYNFPSKDWKDISKEAKDFIRRLLQMDATKRMTAEEALNHPWIERCTTKVDRGMSCNVIAKIMTYMEGFCSSEIGGSFENISLTMILHWSVEEICVAFTRLFDYVFLSM
mmetsp:Transcript_41939/g.88044  ORF Transcript_41939/g.88044 Transcript_41939/m.88044 type:complete len:213 (-) Transcript_41939:2-640(-)